MNTRLKPVSSTLEHDQVAGLLRAIPRCTAPPALTRIIRRELARERRAAQTRTLLPLWPAAVAVQLVLFAGMCAMYFFAVPPTVSVVEPERPEVPPSSQSASPHERSARDTAEPHTAQPSSTLR